MDEEGKEYSLRTNFVGHDETVENWIEKNADEFKMITQRRDKDKTMVDRALETVRNFIIDRNLILFGGLAIDYALRLKGSKIYPDDDRPDFDFLSPHSVDDAYDLADILYRKGFENVGAIRAIHVQTMRVRTNFISVADIGYAPPDVFEKLPFIIYKGMKIIHPDFQRMDQHLAFCFPFNDPPREDVFNRWRKDLKRFNLLNQYYPIDVTPMNAPIHKIIGKTLSPMTGDPKTLKIALHGFAAYAAIRRSLDDLANILNVNLNVNAQKLSLKFNSANSIEMESPIDLIHLVTYDETIIGPSTKFYPYMDIYPESFKCDNVIYLSTQNRLLSASVVDIDGSLFWVVSPQFLLLYFLFEAYNAPNKILSNMYRTYYLNTLEILRSAEELFSKIDNDNALFEFSRSPFAPTIRTFGELNHSSSYIIKMAGNVEKTHKPPPEGLGLRPDISKILTGLPRNYYPGSGKIRPPVDYNANILFHRNGAIKKEEAHI